MPDLLSDLLHAASKVASFMQTAPQGVPERVWNEVSPWLSRFVSQATARWLPIISAQVECEVLTPDVRSPTGWASCTHRAVALCDCCGLRTCLQHCRVDADGSAICLECVAEARGAVAAKRRVPPASDPRRPPPAPGAAPQNPFPRGAPPQRTPAQLRAAALRVLGLERTATTEQIRRAYRRLAGKWHADRFEQAGAKAKAAAAEKFRQIQQAWEILKPAAE
jgi:hypothetical protein